MPRSALDMHDELLLDPPDGVKHPNETCPFCTDWALLDSGVPSGFDHLDEAAKKAPYGNVTYADPGLQTDGVKRYPIDTEAHARAAWSYINQSGNGGKYSSSQLASIKTKIQAALKKYGAAVSDDAAEGGNNQMDTISKETHEALLEKATRDATETASAKVATLEQANATLEAQVKELTELKTKVETDQANLQKDNERLNGELDTAQVAIKAAQDEVTTLKADIAAKEDAAQKTEVANARAEQVRNLGLFTQDYIAEKAARWAEVDEAAWTERLEEWKTAKGTTTTTTPATDTASALTGTNGQTTTTTKSARRAVLGLA